MVYTHQVVSVVALAFCWLTSLSIRASMVSKRAVIAAQRLSRAGTALRAAAAAAGSVEVGEAAGGGGGGGCSAARLGKAALCSLLHPYHTSTPLTGAWHRWG